MGTVSLLVVVTGTCMSCEALLVHFPTLRTLFASFTSRQGAIAPIPRISGEVGATLGFDARRHHAPCTFASNSTNFCFRSAWSWPPSASAICVMFIEQNFGPHIEQNLASL